MPAAGRATAEPERSGFRGTARFDVLSRIGEGGGGVVYEVIDRERNTRLALKTLQTLTAEAILLLKQEFRSVQDIRHPNLIKLDELFDEGGQWFFTMELIEGQDFLSFVRPGWSRAGTAAARTTGRLDEARLRSALVQVVHGVSALHRAHKVHRDIKPTNVLVTEEGRAVVLDLGVASDLARDHGQSIHGIVGSADYMAPEQAASEAVGPPADWYAVGAMLYEALTGSVPFQGAFADVLERKLVAEPPSPRAVAAGVPADLDALCADLLRIDPSARPTGQDILRRLNVEETSVAEDAAPVKSASFVGRRAELDVLEQAYAQSRLGSAVTVRVHGESGVGKSFLVHGFADRLVAEHGALLCRGRCYERESVPYKAVDGALEDLCRFLGELSDDDVRRLLPPNAALLPKVFHVFERIDAIARAPRAEEVLNPQELRSRIFEALRGLLTNIARAYPLVVVIDDMQWADRDSLALFAQIMRPAHAPPLLLIATRRRTSEQRLASHRPSPGGGAVETGRGDVRDIQLGALPVEDARELAMQLLGGGGGKGTSAEIQAIVNEAQGHPLFIDELIRQRTIRGADKSPLRLDDALWHRVTRLEPAGRRLVELVAVAGMPLAQQTMASAASVEFGELFDLVATLRTANFVRTTGVHRQDKMEPYHDRIRESVLAHIEPAARKECHRRLALALEESSTADPEALANHWQGAGSPERAAHYAVVGADQAVKGLAFDHAVRLYRLALALATEGAADVDALRTKLGEALTNAGRSAEAGEVYLEVARDDRSPRALELRRRAANEFISSGHFDRGLTLLRDVLRAVGIRYPATLLEVVFLVVFYRVVLRLRGYGYRQRSPDQIDPAELLRVDCCAAAGSAFGTSDHVRGAYFNVRGSILALRAGDPLRMVSVLTKQACTSSTGGSKSRAETETIVRVVEKLAEGLNVPHAYALSIGARGWASCFLGEWRSAGKDLARSETLFRESTGGLFDLNSVRKILFRALVSMGALKDLAERAPAVLREAEEKGDLHTCENLRSTVTYLLALAGDDPDQAGRELALATVNLSKERFHVPQMTCLMAAGQIDLYRGAPEEACQRLSASWGPLRRSLLLKIQIWRLWFLDQRARCSVAAAAASRSTSRGASLLRAADDDARAILREGVPWSNPLAWLLRGTVAAVQGDRMGAITSATQALAGFEMADMGLHAAVARRRLGEWVGGTEGARNVSLADEWMRAQGIVNPRRMAGLYAPCGEPEWRT